MAPSADFDANVLVGDGTDQRARLPKLLSPSRASDFAQCPAKFYFKSILRLPSPATEATTKGTLAHEAFEKIFDHPRGERTAANAVPYVRAAWEELKGQRNYANVVALGPERVEKMLCDAEDAVRAWFNMEDPNRFDPEGRELRLALEAAGVPMVGILDRVDRVVYPSGQVRFLISDYKTGKVPGENDRFLDEKFFGMKVYAMLFHELTGIVPFQLRLVYVAGGHPSAVRKMACDEALIRQTRARVKSMWDGMRRSAARGQWQPRKQPLCQWCEFQDICPAWNPELAGVPVDVEAYKASVFPTLTEAAADAPTPADPAEDPPADATGPDPEADAPAA